MSLVNESPFFTVVIPTRNRPVEFAAALNSVLSQTCNDLEVIVVNDGTNAANREAYNKIEAHSSHNVSFINLIERTRGHGHCFARNEGVVASKGHFICFLDDDDVWIDEQFLSRAKTQIKNCNADLFIANQQAITHDGKEIKNVWVEDIPSTFSPSDPRLKQEVFEINRSELLKSKGFAHQNTCIVEKQLFESVGGMDENMRYEPDRDIYWRLLDNAAVILYDTNTVALHNVPNKDNSKNASTQTNRLEKLLFQLRTANKGLLFAKNEDIFDSCKHFKLYTLKHIATELVQKSKYKKAVLYAKQALAIKFSIKWFLWTQLIKIKALGSEK
ncbi:MAG: glycosyltransferase [Alteromonadaceae bacterium]|nr:glycosyltransferase [Alteromonadaceae bacterium]